MQMSLSRFRQELRRGRGSALLALKNSGGREVYFDAVLWCCLHNTCYDAQCEGDRSRYLYDAICLFDDKSRFEDAIIERLRGKNPDLSLFGQLVALLCFFADEGSGKALNALLGLHDDMFATLISRRKPKMDERESFELLCICLTKLIGFTFFKETVERVGLHCTSSDVEWPRFFIDWFYDSANSEFGKKRIKKYLEKCAAKSAATAAFLKEVTEYKIHWEGGRQEPTLEQYLKPENTDSRTAVIRKRIISRRILPSITPEDLMVIAERAVMEVDLDFRAALLQIFSRTPFPLDERYIVEFAESGHERLREIAFKMMEQVKSEAMRGYALGKLQQDEDIPDMIAVLCSQDREQDEVLIFEKLKRMPVRYNNGRWHGAYMSVEDAIEQSRRRPQTEVLLYMYRNTLCSYCRESIVKLMCRKRVLPREVLEECTWDCNTDTRKWAERVLKRMS